LSGGVPRVINRLCDRALHHAHARRATVVDPALVRMAATDVDPASLTGPVASADTTTSSTSVDATLAAANPAAPSVAGDELSDSWFAAVDEQVSKTPDPTDGVDFMATAEFAMGTRPRRRAHFRSEPLTHMQSLQRMWWQRLKIAALFAIIIGGAGFGLSVAYAILDKPIVAPTTHAPVVAERPVSAITSSDTAVLDIAPVDVPASISSDDDAH